MCYGNTLRYLLTHQELWFSSLFFGPFTDEDTEAQRSQATAHTHPACEWQSQAALRLSRASQVHVHELLPP